MATVFCRHIRANGTRCNSPALRGQPLCYFHHRDRLRYPNRRQQPLHGEAPEDFELLQAETILHPLNPDSDGLQREPQASSLLRNPLVREYFGLPADFTLPAGPLVLDFPPLEDRESIQIAISMVTSALGQGAIDAKRAGILLYAFQVASANAKTLTRDPHTVTDAIPSPDGHDLAPDEDPEPPAQPLSSAARLLHELEEIESRGKLPFHQDLLHTQG